MAKRTLDLLYRCGANYKTFFSVVVDTDYEPEAKDLKVSQTFDMGEYNTPSEDDFFDSEIYPHSYDNEYDHNILQIVEIREGVQTEGQTVYNPVK